MTLPSDAVVTVAQKKANTKAFVSKPWSRPRTECTASLLRFDMDQARVHGVGDKVSGAVPLATVNADRGSWSDPHQHSCHEDNDGGGKRHPLRKHHFLPL